MDEKKKPEQPKPEKKLSRTTLTFYIVGLFSVAIALILISYVAQARADKQLDSLSDQLTEQQTVAQGATQKMEDLQKQYDAINSALDEVRTSLDCELAETDVVSAVKQRMEEREVYALLAQINAQLQADNQTEAKQAYQQLVDQYGEDRLLGNTEDSFDSDINKLFEAVQKHFPDSSSETDE